MKRTLEQNKRLHQLLTTTGLTEDKASLVGAYSNGRTTSSSELLVGEADQLIAHLEAIAAEQTKYQAPRVIEDDPADRMRKKIIAKAHEMRWEVAGSRADMARINAWCREKSFGKKPLNAYTLDELPQLVSQFDLVYKKYLLDLTSGR